MAGAGAAALAGTTGALSAQASGLSESESAAHKSRVLERIQAELSSSGDTILADHVHVKSIYTKANGFAKEINFAKALGSGSSGTGDNSGVSA